MTSLLRGDVPAAAPSWHSRDINKGADLTVQEANWTNASVIRTYDRWAPLYDVVFGSIFAQARRKAVEAPPPPAPKAPPPKQDQPVVAAPQRKVG